MSAFQPLFFASSSDEGEEGEDRLIEPQPGSEPAQSSPEPDHMSTFDVPAERLSQHSTVDPFQLEVEDLVRTSPLTVSTNLPSPREHVPVRSTVRKAPPDGADVIQIDFDDIPPSSSFSNRASSPIQLTTSSQRAEPPTKKRRISLSTSTLPDVSTLSVASSKRAQSSPPLLFLGTFMCGNAFSAVKGRGYTEQGQEIFITRDDEDDEPTKPTKAKETPKGKGAGKRQLTLSTLMKPGPSQKRKKKNTIVRITNPRGFGATVFCSVM
jgi:hypothetical protein